MITTLDLWPTLHDGDLDAVHEVDDVLTLQIDVPHVRKHHGHDNTQRYQMRCEGVTTRTFTLWTPTDTPEPADAEGANTGWWSKGTFVAQEWSQFARSITAHAIRCCVIEATLDEGTPQVLKLHGNYGNDWFALTVEARVIVFTETSGSVHTTSEFIALGEAYWTAWSRKHASK